MSEKKKRLTNRYASCSQSSISKNGIVNEAEKILTINNQKY
jgi:hypothetical protein